MGVKIDATRRFGEPRVRTHRDALAEIDRSLTVAIDALDRATDLGIELTPDLIRCYVDVLKAIRAFAEIAAKA